eukprot:scaffold45757_cov56-Attheya_sp.AAC.4
MMVPQRRKSYKRGRSQYDLLNNSIMPSVMALNVFLSLAVLALALGGSSPVAFTSHCSRLVASQELLRDAFRPIGVTATYKYISFKRMHTRSPLRAAQDFRQDETKKKKKKNKYAKFSKADQREKDPFEALVEESEMKQIELETETARRKNQPLPKSESIQTSNDRERNKYTFPDTKAIDPYDPTTYGYTELGTMVGAHGVHGWVKLAAATQFASRLCQEGIRHLKAPNRRSPREVYLLEGKPTAQQHNINKDPIYLVRIQHVYNRTSAQKLTGSILYARQEQKPAEPVGPDEYLVTDLVGLDVYLEEGYGDDRLDKDEDEEVTLNDDAEEELMAYLNNMEDGEEEEEEEELVIHHTQRLGGSFVGTVGGIVLADEICAVPGLGNDMLEVVLPRGLHGSAPSWRDDLILIPLVDQIVPRVDLQNRAIYITPPWGLLDLTYVREEKVRIRGFLPEVSSYIKNTKNY